ncbi:MAG TPA: methyltransferase domain-containing protein [Longimicrobiaceae bacterium]|nr:methyltransferase domain-containing protein [Longimicrobiaceae bacterium]
METFYGEDLAHVHHAGFGGFATGAAPGLLAMLRSAGIPGGLVVDLGCGSGLWARALLDAGYSVLGVDRSPAMIRAARAVAPGARFVEASLHGVEIPPCAAVTGIGEGLGYLGAEDPRDTLPGLFARVHGALDPGGLLVFDVVLRSAARPVRYRSVREGEGWRVETEVEEDPGASLLTRRIATMRSVDGDERRGGETHRVRTFARAELERMLRDAGFTVRVHRRYGGMPLAPGRLAFRARRPPR